jgi:hypothetical protein
MSQNTPHEHNAHGLAHERKDFDLRVVVGTAVVTVIVAIVVHVGLRYFQVGYNRQAERHDPLQPPAAALHGEPPGPALRPAPIRDLSEFRRAQQGRLEGYAWVDEEHERVRIPITRAMELLAERGLPATPDSESNQSQSEPPNESQSPDSLKSESP